MTKANKQDISRRQLSVSLGAGIVTSVAGISCLAKAAEVERLADKEGVSPTLVDPRHLYPAPPFPMELQKWPGLAAKMNPRPDHGETSYRGHSRLVGLRALITGGDSGIGRAAAIAFAREGADVAFNYLPEEQSDADEVMSHIQGAGRRGFAIPGGPFWTPLQVSGGSPDDWVVNYGRGTVWDRPGQPAEIASTFVLLADQRSTYITGQVLGLTGGSGRP